MIQLHKPFIRRQDMESVLTCLVTDEIGPAHIKEQLIREFCTYTDTRNGMAFREYYRAIRASLELLEIGRGDSVIISPLAHRIYGIVFEDLGIRPLYADVDPDSACINPENIHLFRNEEPKAVILYYNLGMFGDTEPFRELSIPVIEDITQSLGGMRDEVPVGQFGDIVILSLEIENLITSGGGALMLTRSKSLSSALKKKTEEWPLEMILPDFNASLALKQWQNFPDYLQTRQKIYDIFKKAYLKSRHKTLQQKNDWVPIPYGFPVLLETGLKRIEQYTRKNRIEIAEAFVNTIMNFYPDADNPCPNAKSFMLKTVLFPLYPSLKKDDIDIISKVLATLP